MPTSKSNETLFMEALLAGGLSRPCNLALVISGRYWVLNCFWFSLVCQERFHFSPQRVIPRAGFVKESDSLALFTLPSGVIKLFDFLPTIRRHSLLPYSFCEPAKS